MKADVKQQGAMENMQGMIGQNTEEQVRMLIGQYQDAKIICSTDAVESISERG